ncbi:hypothetical protein ACFL6S_33700 [Candidatus Poribacteria bacterium]
MAKSRRRKQKRIKTLMSTTELIEAMEEHLPIPVYPCEELCELLRNQGKDISRGTELQITKVYDSGDAGGIMCPIIKENSEVYVVSLTHLMTKPGHPLHRRILEYKRKRIRKLSRQII